MGLLATKKLVREAKHDGRTVTRYMTAGRHRERDGTRGKKADQGKEDKKTNNMYLNDMYFCAGRRKHCASVMSHDNKLF